MMTPIEKKTELLKCVQKTLDRLRTKKEWQTAFNRHGCHECVSSNFVLAFKEAGASARCAYVTTQDEKNARFINSDGNDGVEMRVRFGYVDGSDEKIKETADELSKELVKSGLKFEWSGSVNECILARFFAPVA
jgi:hypothetical protein